MRDQKSGTKDKHKRGKQIIVAIAPSLAKEIGDSITSASIACTNREGGENKCNCSKPIVVSRVCTSVSPIYYKYE